MGRPLSQQFLGSCHTATCTDVCVCVENLFYLAGQYVYCLPRSIVFKLGLNRRANKGCIRIYYTLSTSKSVWIASLPPSLNLVNHPRANQETRDLLSCVTNTCSGAATQAARHSFFKVAGNLLERVKLEGSYETGYSPWVDVVRASGGVHVCARCA